MKSVLEPFVKSVEPLPEERGGNSPSSQVYHCFDEWFELTVSSGQKSESVPDTSGSRRSSSGPGLRCPTYSNALSRERYPSVRRPPANPNFSGNFTAQHFVIDHDRRQLARWPHPSICCWAVRLRRAGHFHREKPERMDEPDKTAQSSTPWRQRRILCFSEFALIAAVYGADFYDHLFLNKVPYLFLLAWISLRLRGLGWRGIGLRVYRDWCKTLALLRWAESRPLPEWHQSDKGNCARCHLSM